MSGFQWLVFVLAIIGPVESRLLPTVWNVTQVLDSHHMKVIAVNGNTSAPDFEVLEEDKIEVDVINNLEEDLEIEWRGIEQDVTPGCHGIGPIETGQTDRYCLSASEAGEFSYQAKSKLQSDAGLKGSGVILEKVDKNPGTNG